MTQIDISIITPCYNSGLYLTGAIESVRKYNGKYHYEIILIDDGSTDEYTLKVLKTLQNEDNITLISQKNSGAAAARNAGCHIAKGEYLLFLDSDNKIYPEYIEEGIDFLKENTDFGVFYGKPKFIGDGSRYGFDVAEFDIDIIIFRNYVDMCAVVRKKAFDDACGFDESLKRFQDYDLWLSIYEKNWKFHFVDKKLYEYRILENSITGKSENENLGAQVHAAILYKHYKLVKERLMYIKSQNEKLQKSPEMRLGKFLLAPLRFVKNKLK